MFLFFFIKRIRLSSDKHYKNGGGHVIHTTKKTRERERRNELLCARMYLVLEKLYRRKVLNVKMLLKIDSVWADTRNYSKTVVPLYLAEWYFKNVKRLWQFVDVWCHSDSVRWINDSGIHAFRATHIFLQSYRKIMFCTCRRGVKIDGLEKYEIVLVNELLYTFFFFFWTFVHDLSLFVFSYMEQNRL